MTLQQLIQLLKQAERPEQIETYRTQITQLIPEVSIMFEYDQNNRYHQYDLWTHTLMTVCDLPNDLDDVVYLAALLHDIGKVESRCRGNRENDRQSHYYGHPQVSARIVKQQIIPRLLQSDRTMDDQMVHDLVWLVEHHDDALPSECSRVKRIREKIGGRLFQMWMELQIADARAHVILPKVLNRIVICEKWLVYTD